MPGIVTSMVYAFFLLILMWGWGWWLSCQVMSNSWDPMDCSLPGSSGPWDFSGENTGVGCRFNLQAIFLTQGLNLWTCVSCVIGRCFTAEPPESPKCVLSFLFDKWRHWSLSRMKVLINVAQLKKAVPGFEFRPCYSRVYLFNNKF